jgi:voltage-gated potassium channel
MTAPSRLGPTRRRLHEIIFEADTPAGRAFDLLLIGSILASVVVVMLDSVASVRAEHGALLRGLEWGFTLLFTVEYVLRLVSVGKPIRYATSFYGVVDLLSILPTYLSVLLPGSQALIVIRILRVLRVFRVLKLAHFVIEAQQLKRALQASSRKILVFLFAVVTVVVIVGSAMHLIEGPENGFSNIPLSVYWAIVTLTTVGYGDLSPGTDLGRFLASLLMILGYGLIAVPTGIVTVALGREPTPGTTTLSCNECSLDVHAPDARYCRGCGALLHPDKEPAP